MNLSLYQKLSISLVITFILIVVAFLYISQHLDSLSKDKAEQELHYQLAEHLVHDNPLLASNKFDQKALKNLFHSMMILGQSFEFYVLDIDGNILHFDAEPGVVIRDKIDILPIRSFVDKDHTFPIYAQDPRGTKQKIFSAAPIIFENNLKGYLYVIVRSQIYDSIFQKISSSSQIQVYGLVVLASILFLFAILMVSFRFIIAPLRQLTNEVSALEKFDASQPIIPLPNNKTGKEVDSLRSTFNQMIKHINQQFDRLKQVDFERRELLTHLAHDLRTPLASLQGFLETTTIQDNDLSEEDRRAYLSRCLKNAQQLKHFVDQIFELAHLESDQVSATFEPLPITELLYDLAEKFSIKCREKDIDISVEVDDESVQTVTDIAKLERVLSNLIENSIRHTPKNGKIMLRVLDDVGSKKVLVEVRDTGSGIPENELPYLFEPRYRGSKAKEDGIHHIGLGLTISEKLLKILGSKIEVSNNPDCGARFSFSLPVS